VGYAADGCNSFVHGGKLRPQIGKHLIQVHYDLPVGCAAYYLPNFDWRR
jgi:hypothetical protein